MRAYLLLFTVALLVSCGGQSKEELIQQGDQLRSEGNYRGAVVLYKNALEKDANDLVARSGLAEAYLQSGNLDQAEKEFQKVLLQDPTSSGLLLKLATIYIQQNKPQQALLELDKYHSKNTQSVESLVLYGRAHGASGDLASAEKLFKEALQVDPQAADPHLNLARVYLQQDDYDQARTHLQATIERDADEIQAYFLLAGLETRQGHVSAALQAYQDAIAVDPNQLQAHYMSGILQMDQGDLEAAAATVQTLKSRFPERAEGPRLEGLLLYRQGQYENARIALENSLQTEQHLLTYFFLGLSYYGLEQFELALNQFQQALDLNPDFERARILVSMTLLKQQRLDDAIIEIQKVLRANPNNAYAHNILGSAYLADGQYDKGMDELEQATQLDPNLADAHLKQGVFKLSRGEGQQGEADLVKAVEAAPEVMNSRLMLVTHYLRQKNYSAAIDALKEGMNGTKADALLHNYLAAAYFSQNKPKQALAALEQAKQANPDYLTPYFNIASYHASRSAYGEALAEYRRVLEKDSRNMRALLSIAALHNVQGDDKQVDQTFKQIEATDTERGYAAAAQHQLRRSTPQAALEIVDRGLQNYPASASLLELKGGLHLQLEQIDDAETAYTQLAASAPEQGHSRLVRLYLNSGRVEDARQLINDLLIENPDQDYPYLLAAGLARAEQNQDKAVAVLQDGIARVVSPVRLRMQLGRVYEQTGKLEQAEQLYHRVLQEQPRFAPAYTALGFIEERRGNKGAARDYYRQTLQYDKNNVPALNNLAYLLTDNFGEAGEALDLAMAAYRLQPNDPRIMDTLGYVLVENQRADDAMNLLEKALQMLPEVPAVRLHLALAKIAAGDREGAAPLLQQVAEEGSEAEADQARALLQEL